MKNRFFKSMFALVFAVMSAFVLTACAGKWDATKIKVGTTTFAYDGSSHVFEVDYEEAKVDVTVTYSTTATGEFKPASELSFVNVGTYSLYYKLTAEGFDDYVSAEPVEFTITVARMTVNTQEELLAAITNYGTANHVIVLGQDVVLSTGVEILTGEYTLDLNGHKISAPHSTSTAMIKVEGTAKLTIDDSVGTGVVDSASDSNNYSIAVWGRNGGTVVLKAGKFTNLDAKSVTGTTPNNNELIYVSGEGSNITIEGGMYVGNYNNAKWGTRYALNQHDATKDVSSILVKGGSFVDYNPAESLSEAPQKNFVATGYEVSSTTADGHTIYTVAPSA